MTYTVKVVEDDTERVVGVIPELSPELCSLLIRLWKVFFEYAGSKVTVIGVNDDEGKGITREDVRSVVEKWKGSTY